MPQSAANNGAEAAEVDVRQGVADLLRPIEGEREREQRQVAGSEGSFCHLVVIHSTRAAGYEPRIAHVSNDFDVSYALVAAGAGVGLVPELAGPPPPGVVLRADAGALPARRIYLAVRAGRGERPALAAMLAALSGR